MSHDKRCRDYEQRVMSLVQSGGHAEASTKAERLYRELRNLGQLPLTCGNRAYFMFHGPAEEVAIAGDWTRWQVATPFNRIRGTDLFYEIIEFPDDARLQYKLIVDGEWIRDPGNHRRVEEGFGTNSEFWMPLHHDPSLLWTERADTPKSSLVRNVIRSTDFGTREYYLYTPARVDNAGSAMPLLFVHDGEEAIRLGRFSVILDNLIAQKRIPPCAAVFLPPKKRGEEYLLNEAYLSFCVNDVLSSALDTWAKASVAVAGTPTDHAVLGASLGGLLALWTVATYPGKFASCIAQSPALWPQRGRIFRLVESADMAECRVIIQTGTIGDARELAHLMTTRLISLEVDVTYREYNQGHTWGNWRSTFADAIENWIGPDRL